MKNHENTAAADVVTMTAVLLDTSSTSQSDKPCVTARMKPKMPSGSMQLMVTDARPKSRVQHIPTEASPALSQWQDAKQKGGEAKTSLTYGDLPAQNHCPVASLNHGHCAMVVRGSSSRGRSASRVELLGCNMRGTK